LRITVHLFNFFIGILYKDSFVVYIFPLTVEYPRRTSTQTDMQLFWTEVCKRNHFYWKIWIKISIITSRLRRKVLLSTDSLA